MTNKKVAMSGPDAAWLRMDSPTNFMMITSIMMFDEVLTLDEVKTLLEERFLLFDRFRQRVLDRNGTPHWQDDPYFDLDRHIHRVALPAPGGQEELQAMVSDLMCTPLDFSKPLWQIHLVENYGTGCALIWRIHHCIADGIALTYVMMSTADEYFDPSKIPARKKPDEGGLADIAGPALKAVSNAISSTVKVAGAVLNEGKELLLHPSHVLDLTKQGMSLGAATSKILLMPADSDTLFKGELGVMKRAAWSQPVPLQAVKDIKKDVDAKVNDVLMSAVTGALRRYLIAHDQPVEDVEIRASIPVNLRPLEEAYKLGNQFGLVFLSLPVGIEDPRERLLEIKRRMDRIKHSSEAIVTLGILQALGHAPKRVEDQVVDILSTKASAVMTNVPGPRERLHLGGKALRHIMFWVPRAGAVSMGISIISYVGEVMLGVATDARLVANPEAIIEGFHAEFDALQEAFA